VNKQPVSKLQATFSPYKQPVVGRIQANFQQKKAISQQKWKEEKAEFEQPCHQNISQSVRRMIYIQARKKR